MRISYHDRININTNISKVSAIDIKNYQKGDVLKGDILDVQQKNVVIRLANGTQLTAKLTDQMEFSIGQKVLFQVKNSNLDQILLKPVMDQTFNPKNNKLFQVLEEAGVTINERNVEIVNKLLDNNMPIDKDFINNIIKLSRQFKDTSIDKLILLMKNNIPVTKDSIEQLNNYEGNNNSMKQEVISLANRIIDNNDTIAKQELIKILINNRDGQQSIGNESNVINKKGMEEQSVKTGSTTDLGLGSIIPEANLKELENEINGTYKLKGNNILSLSKELTLQDLQQEILSLDMSEEDKADINKTITNRLLTHSVDKNIYLNHKALEDPKILNEYFNNVYEKIVSIIRFTSTALGDKNNNIVKDAVKVKNNIEFMNSLNNNFNYVQLPFKFNNKLLNSELYIFENKKELRKKGNSDAITALIRLDYVNLGHMDVYIAKQARNVDCKFYVEDEEKKNIINEHINKLYKRIKSFDYNITGLMVIGNSKDFDFVEDFISRKDEAKGVKRYTFDMRV